MLTRLDEPGDAELISAVRGGDVSAYGDLFERHVGAARRLARQLVGSADADDLVSDAFAKVLRVLQSGGGPDVSFRAYLLTSVRRLHVDKIRANSRLHTTDDMESFDPGVPFRDTAVEGFESAAAAKAFASLPERWQAVLWHTEVEGQKPAEVAVLLGMSPNSVSALAYRAREGLRQAFLNSHIAELDDDNCTWTHEHLGAYVRSGISKRDAAKVERHIDDCRKCMAIYLELTEVNSNLAGILAPLLLGSAGIPYLAASSLAAKGGILLLLDRGKEWVSSNAPATAAAGVVAVAVVAAGAFALTAGDDAPAPTPPPAAAPAAPGGGDQPDGGGAAPPADPPADPPVTPPTPAPVDEPAAPPAAPAPAAPPPVAPPPPPPPPPALPRVDLSVEVIATRNTPTGPSGMSARAPIDDYTISVTVSGLRDGVRARIPAPTAAPGVVYTGNCKGGCVVTVDDPRAIIGATNTSDRPQRVTLGATPVGGREISGADNRRTVTLQPVATKPPPTEPPPTEPPPSGPTVDFGVSAPLTVAATPLGASGKHRGTFEVSVTGVSGSGQTGTLTAITSAGQISSRDCASPCVVSADGVYTFVVEFDDLTTATASFTIEPNPTADGEEVRDTNALNDRASTVVTPTHAGPGHPHGGSRNLLGDLLGAVTGLLVRR